jgi:pilus assembly protein CpaF
VNGARRVTHITEVLGLEGEVITLQDLFVAQAAELRPGGAHPADFLGPLLCTGLQPRFQERLAAQGVALPPEFFLAEETDMPVRVLARSSRRK